MASFRAFFFTKGSSSVQQLNLFDGGNNDYSVESCAESEDED